MVNKDMTNKLDDAVLDYAPENLKHNPTPKDTKPRIEDDEYLFLFFKEVDED